MSIGLPVLTEGADGEPFGIHIVDEATGRGVPLVTLDSSLYERDKSTGKAKLV